MLYSDAMTTSHSQSPKAVTIKEVARETGLSVVTVARALGGYGRISDKTRERICAVAKDLGYRPNMFAKGLKGKTTQTIGLMIANVCNPFFSIIVRAVEDVCSSAGYSVIVCNIDEEREKERKYLELLRDKRIDGLLVCSSFTSRKEMGRDVARLYEKEIPTVFVDRRVDGLTCPAVQTDSFAGSTLAVNHLVKLGHRRIGLLSHAANVDTIQNRTAGFVQALKDNGIEPTPDYIAAHNTKTTADGYETAKRVLALRKRPTAILTTNSLLTFGALTAIREAGLRIPEDIAFVGWDEFDLAAAMAVTVVTQPVYTIGSIAVTKLLDILKGSGSRESVLLSPELLVRASCGAELGRRRFS